MINNNYNNNNNIQEEMQDAIISNINELPAAQVDQAAAIAQQEYSVIFAMLRQVLPSYTQGATPKYSGSLQEANTFGWTTTEAPTEDDFLCFPLEDNTSSAQQESFAPLTVPFVADMGTNDFVAQSPDPNSPSTKSTLSEEDAYQFAAMLDAVSTITVRSCKLRQGSFDKFDFQEVDAAALRSDLGTNCPELLTSACQFCYALETNEPVSKIELVCLSDMENTPIELKPLKQAPIQGTYAYDLSIVKNNPNRKQRTKLQYALRLTCAVSGAVKIYGPFVLNSRPPTRKQAQPAAVAAAPNLTSSTGAPKTQANKRKRDSDALKLEKEL